MANKGSKVKILSQSKQTVPLIHHPLHQNWTLWYFSLDSNKDWKLCQQKVATVKSVEEFWSLMLYLLPVSRLRNGTEYSFFVSGIMPMWEDEANRHGGRWIVSLGKQEESEFDLLWINILMGLTGGEYNDYCEQICGVVVSVKDKGDKISLWTKDCDETTTLAIGKILKRLHNIPEEVTIGYQLHSGSKIKSSIGYKYTV